MKKVLFSTAIAAALSLTFSSCSEDSHPVVETPSATESLLNVTTDIAVTSRSVLGRPIESFVSGDEIGLFVCADAIGTPYNGVVSNKNVKSTFTTQWTQASPVYLSSAMATIYAYYPWASSITDGTMIDINHTTQTDFMYSAPVSNINSEQSTAAISMNHALSLVQFDFKKENYNGVGSLTAITIANKSGGKALISEGKLNISNGTITKGTAVASVTRATNLPQTIGSWTESTFPKMLVMPTSATTAAGDIIISFTIDGHVYNWALPSATAWEQGKKNTYTVTLKGTGLSVSEVTITPWVAGKTDSGIIQ